MLKEYTFDFYAQTFEPGWEDYEYFSSDLDTPVRQPLFNERECFVAVLRQEGLLPEDFDATIFSTDSLEQILLENQIYVKFHDGE